MSEREKDGPVAGETAPGGGGPLSGELTAGPSLPGVPVRGPFPPTGLSGTVVAHFEILERIGAGGFGEVYRARDTRLGRIVAVKVLPEAFARDAERRERFRREAVAASALNHPNICTVHDLVEADGRYLIVMELVEGETLHAALKGGPFPVAKLLPVAEQIAEALGEAHRAGILHRDIKTANIALTPRGQVKVLDFGLAKLSGAGGESPDERTAERLTAAGSVYGTLSYMSPEQLLGRPLDGRSDLFSFGVVLYEMATGRLPFEGSSGIGTADAILHAEPRRLDDRPVPPKLAALLGRLLQKEPARRYPGAGELLADLKALRTESSGGPSSRPGLPKGAWPAIGLAAVVLLAGAGWSWHRASRSRWAREAATPEIARRLAAEDFAGAAALAREARAVLPGDPTLEKLWTDATMEVSVTSTPGGAEVAYRPYRGDANRWETLGRTPLDSIRVPRDYYVWRVGKPGFAPAFQIAPTWTIVHRFKLEVSAHLAEEASVPAGMVRVTGGKTELAIPGLEEFPEVALEDFAIDRCEVTNEEFAKFVEARGYERREFWKQPLVRDGRTVPWEEGVALFLDATGRPGPSTWETGSFPKGTEKHPVAGVSWYEAAAYAEFAGRSLPTIYHWNRAAQTRASLLIAPGSNFAGAGTVPVGGAAALSGFGTSDMAGNVKEWCLNESRAGKRYLLGGGFGEPTYMFIDQDAQSPWDRHANYGFRCVKLPAPPPAAAAAKVEPAFRDFTREKPVSEEVFRAFRALYAYDRGDLDAKVEATEATEDGTRERVSYRAAYGGERIPAYFYLPKGVLPPFQVVVYFPGSGAISADKFALSPYADFVTKSGRALLAPIYKSTFERRDGLKSDVPEPTVDWRDHMIAWSKDLGRSLDYLETRKEIDRERIAYLGLSWGAAVAPNLLAVEGRIRTAILESGGLEFQRPLPEVDAINFVTRVRIPVLMVNGRFDHFFPVESSQLPLFRLLGAPESEKRHVLYESGHAPPRKELIRESLGWLDRYLGPVRRRP